MNPGLPPSQGSNPWVAGPDTPGYNTRLTYASRPEWFARHLPFVAAYPVGRWDMIRTTETAVVKTIPTGKMPLFPTPRDFTNKSASAIVMDMNDTISNRAVVHRGGMNALYADWSAKTVPTGMVKRHVDQINKWERTPDTKKRRRAHFDLWLELDRF